MSWNDQGNNNGSRDPWGRNNNPPPDIDELIKKFRAQINSIFGGGSGDGGGGIKKILPSVLIAIVLLYSAFGIYTVDAQEEAVILRFGKYSTTKGPGIHWNPPFIDNRFIVNTEKLFTHTTNSSMLTKDENIVNVEVAVQYKRSNPVFFLLEASAPEDSLAQASEAELRHVVGSTTMDSTLTVGREQIAMDVKSRLQTRLDTYRTGIEVVAVSIRESRPPDAVKEAFDDVVKAREGEVRLRNEAEAYRNDIIPKARGEAERKIQEAEAYKQEVVAKAQGEAQRFISVYDSYKTSKDVTRERIYLETLEKTLGKIDKIIVDKNAGSGIVPYLPLPELQKKNKINQTINNDE